MRRALLVALLLSLLTVLLPVAASAGALTPCQDACSCADVPLEEKVDRADVVVVGTVTDEARPSPSGVGGEVVYTLDVDEAIKGDVPATVRVSTPGDSATCGVTLTKGERYLLVASRSEGRLRTMLCSGTGPATSARVADARAVVPDAEQGSVTPAATEEEPADEPDGDGTAAKAGAGLVGGAALMGAVIVGMLVVRRRRADGP